MTVPLRSCCNAARRLARAVKVDPGRAHRTGGPPFRPEGRHTEEFWSMAQRPRGLTMPCR